MILRALVPFVLTVGLAAPAPSATTPDRDAQMRLIALIQAERPDRSGDPPATQDLGWLRWQPQHAECRSALDMAWAAVVDNDCGRMANGVPQGEMYDTLKKIYEAGKSLHDILEAPDEVAKKNLEAVAAAFDVPQNAVKCLAKTYIRATLPDGPDRQIQLQRVDALADTISMGEMLSGLKALKQEGLVSLGETGAEQAAGISKTASQGLTQPVGWVENIVAAAESFYVGKMAGMEARQARAQQRLDQCVTVESRMLWEALVAEALAYVEETRKWAMDLEKRVYCESLANASTNSLAITDSHSQLVSVYAFDRLAVQKYEAVVAEAQQAEALISKQEEELDRMVENLEGIATELDSIWQSCDDQGVDRLQRRLGELSQSRCLQYATATAGLDFNVPDLRLKLQRFGLAQERFFPTVRRADTEARALLKQCRFHEVLDPIDQRFHTFETTWSPFTIATFRHCWPPSGETDPDLIEWPPDKVERDSNEARDVLLGQIAVVREALDRAVEERLACRWTEAWAALKDARTQRDAITCPDDAPNLEDYAVSRDRIEQLEALTNEHQEAIQPKLDAYEQATRDLLQSIEEELYTAEQPDNAERCASADRVIEMAGLAGGMVPPPECPSYPAGDFPERVESARRRATLALELGRADLERLSAEGLDAVGRCDLATVTSALDGLAALPVVCGGADPQEVIDNLDTERAKIERIVDAYRTRIDRYEREWATAYQHCDLAELRAVANAIAAWSPNTCARANLSQYELGRVAALEQNTVDRVDTILTMKMVVESALLAKFRVGDGYVRTLESLVGNEQAAVEEVRRVKQDALDYIAFAQNYAGPDDLPLMCYDDDLDQVRGLVPTLQRLIGLLGEGGGTADTSTTTTTSTTTDSGGGDQSSAWDEAAATGQTTVSSTQTEPDANPPPPPRPADDQVAAAEGVAASAAEERSRQPPPPSSGDILGPLIQVAEAVAEARSGRTSSGGGGSTGGGSSSGRSTTQSGSSSGSGQGGGTGASRTPCSIIGQQFGGDRYPLIEFPSTTPGQPVAWTVASVPSRQGDTCGSVYACARQFVPGLKEGAGRIVKIYNSWRDAECEAFRRCSQPVYTSGVRRCP